VTSFELRLPWVLEELRRAKEGPNTQGGFLSQYVEGETKSQRVCERGTEGEEVR
jgi:hypothetical protein